MLFFQSLLPYIEKFDNAEMIQLQMGVLQVINSISNNKNAMNPNPVYQSSFVQQSTSYNPQSFNFQAHAQGQFQNSHNHTTLHPQNIVSSVPNQTPSFTQPLAQTVTVVAVSNPSDVKQTKKTPALLPTTPQDNRLESVSQYFQNYIDRDDNSVASSSLCSDASSPLIFDFNNQ